jgi:hypothetical protein
MWSRALIATLFLCVSASVSMGASDVTYDVLGSGSVLVAGNVSIRNTVNAPSYWASNQLAVNPRLMYYVIPRLALGAGLDLNWFSHTVSLTEFGLGPRLGYYFGKQDAKGHPFVETGLSLRTRGTEEGGWAGAGLDVALGLITMVGSSWGSEIRIGYLWESLAQSGDVRGGGVFTLGAGFACWAKKPEDLK